MSDEILTFLIFLSEGLKKGKSPEASLKNALINYSGPIKKQLLLIVNKIFREHLPLKEAWNFFDELTDNVRIRRVLWLVKNALTKNSREAGKILERAVWEIKENQQLVDERKNQLNVQSFKIKILSVASSAVLGLMGSLAPLFSLTTYFFQYQPILPAITSFRIEVYWPPLTALGIISIITSFFTAKMTESKQPIIYSLASFLIFTIVFCLGILTTNMFIQKGLYPLQFISHSVP
ncbi:MAG: hypothetical protein ACTSWF_11620 [Candidatus Freyarchaeota archaeon]